jgi:beta-lactamase superfamily II metal-dependent hydrolase
VRGLLFQSDPLGEFGLIVGTGLIYRLINRTLRSGLSMLVCDRINAGLRLVLFLVTAGVLGYPVGLLRFIVSLVCALSIKNPWQRWSASVAILWVLDPVLLTSMTVLIPLFFQALTLLQVDAWSRRIGFGWLQAIVWHRVSPLLTLGYPLWQTGITFAIFAVWVGTLLPNLQGMLLVGFEGLQAVTQILREGWILRGHASIPLLAVGLVIMKLGQWTPRYRSAWLMAGLVWLPGLSAPWLATLTVIDVGQGNAILLSAPLNRSVVLIDTGRAFALREVTSILDQAGIAAIDALVLTHDDADHSENHPALMADYRVKSMVTTSQDVVLDAMALSALDASVSNPDDNQRSLVYGVVWGNTRFLLTGDADVSNERALLRRYPNVRTDVLVVGHHGSASSTGSNWLGTLQPRLAVISVGSNAYGHPAPSVINRLAAFQIPTVTTFHEGTLRFIITPWGTLMITDSWKLKVLR